MLRVSEVPLLLFLLLVCGTASFGGPVYEIGGHVAGAAIQNATYKGRKDPASRLQLSVALKPRDPEGLTDLVRRLYDPTDPQYHQFLSTQEFKDRYAPTDADVADAVNYLQSRGLHVSLVHGNNLIISVETDTATAEAAFQVELHEYVASSGRVIHSPNHDPVVLAEVGSKIGAVVGLSNVGAWRKQGIRKFTALDPHSLSPHASIGSYMTPTKIRTAFGVSGLAQTGGGETLALFELDGYNLSDINAYAAYFGLTVPTLTNVLVDGASGTAGSNRDEVTLDIEVMMAMAPGIAGIRIYEGPSTDSGVLDTYSRIASDNIAKSVSTSWGSAEGQNTLSFLNSENTIFQQFASQGQSFFAASGDNGAYDDTSHPSNLAVDDPGSQPYVTSVGGTTLTLNGANAWSSETSWGTSSNAQGGGGGISNIWPIPAWQTGLATTANKGSTSMRMVPDVSLDANPATGYSIYTSGNWYAYGGTSAAAPLWAAFTAIVNQGRVAGAMSRLGFANPSLYQIGRSSIYSNCFHDINDSSTNLYYPAVTGYDLSTGWGSLNGAGMYAALTASVLPPLAPATVSLSSGAGQITVSWTASTGAATYSVYRSTSLNGVYGTVATLVAGTSFVDNTVAGGTTYYYYVVAVNAAGNSGSSTIVSATPGVTAPGVPTNFSAVAL
jgi:kumamolisin